MIRVRVYIDGFNLYHALDKLRDNRLKWLDLRKLILNFLDPNVHSLDQVKYFSAYATWKPDAYARHIQYVRALEATGVTPVMGRFKAKDRSCNKCHAKWIGHEEKETDVNIALSLIDDAYQDLYDEAIIVSQDSDLFPAIKLVRQRFPKKTIKIITPPNMRHSKEMAQVVDHKKLGQIKPIHIERSLLPEEIKDGKGAVIAARPIKYAKR
jgi:uncharacterized LabA/DUF88 family protein